jgi:uncharacterized protein DUF4440
MSCAQETHDSDAESKIMALERIAKLQAHENKDLKTLDTVLDEGFVHVDPEGRLLTKPEVLAYVQAVDSLQYIVEAMIVKLHEDTAVVTGLYRMKGVERGGTAAAIRALEHEWVEGQSRNDNHALNLIFDNSLVYIE